MTLSTPPAVADAPPAVPGRRQVPRGWALAAVVAVLAVGVVLRCITPGPLWLDETLSVNIARLSPAELLRALHHDGSPPFYYLLLHGWMALFGTGDQAVRSLSVVISVAQLPLFWLLARRLAGPRVALVTLLVAASSPFAVRYASETRMYGLLSLEALLLGLALHRAGRRPGWRSGVAVFVPAALLLYTHYWALFVLLTLGAVALWRAVRRREPAAVTVVAGLVAAGIAFLPQLPTFLFQSAHTGAPWATGARPQDLLDTVSTWSGPGSWGAGVLVVALLALVVAFAGDRRGTAAPAAEVPGGAAAAAAARGPLVLRGRGVPPGRRWVLALAAPLVVTELITLATHQGFTIRYTSVVWPLWPLCLGFGLVLLGRGRALTVATVLLLVGSLAGSLVTARAPRTQAGQIAARVAALAIPGDVLGYCPDQLAPAVDRALGHVRGAPVLRQVTFADALGPTGVDWRDYAQRVTAADPAAFAAELDRLAGPSRPVFLAAQDGYKPFSDDCARIAEVLRQLRGTPVVQLSPNGRAYERASLLSFDPARP
jgi:mannosyltransferase